jgi:hypothetical protein
MTDVEATFRDLVYCLDLVQLPYLVGGSLASSAFGQPRQTNDIDIVLDLPGSKIDHAVEVFTPTFMISESEIQEAVRSRDPFPSFQLLHLQRFLKVDVFVKPGTPFHDSAFSRRRKIRFIGDVEAYFSAPEDGVLQKIRWYELGNRVSDRQWNDIVQVIEVQADRFDRAYFRRWAAELGISELAEEALAEAWE